MNSKYEKILKTLTETLWLGKVDWSLIEKWEANFIDSRYDKAEQQDHAIFLLTRFMYFGHLEIRALLKSLYRDLYKYSVIESIRRANANTTDSSIINPLFENELLRTRFFGIGNPSESGSHLLYYFRQENELSKDLFIHTHEIFKRYQQMTANPIPNEGLGTRIADIEMKTTIANNNIKHYIFIDDFCGSGTQANMYSKKILEDLYLLKPDAETSYFVLFGYSPALDEIRRNTKFKRVSAVMEFDDSFKCFDPTSRFFKNCGPEIKKSYAEELMRFYGNKLIPSDPMGYKNGQMLFGFFHNTPDNTLPVFSFEDQMVDQWVPIFKRYPKIES